MDRTHHIWPLRDRAQGRKLFRQMNRLLFPHHPSGGYLYWFDYARHCCLLERSSVGQWQRHASGDSSVNGALLSASGALTSASRGKQVFFNFKKQPDKKPKKPTLWSSAVVQIKDYNN